MSKRNTSEVVSDSIALEAKNKALKTIPEPEFTVSIPWDKVYADRAFNVRFDESYEGNTELVNSLREFGLQVRGGDNMAFSLQSDGSYKVLTGNLRYNAMLSLRKRAVEDRKALNDNSPLPFEELKGLVFKGLSYEQELDLMADHTMKKGLNEAELAKEIGELVHHHGMTDGKAVLKFGLDKNKVARYRMIYSMPTVFNEFKIEKSGNKEAVFIKVGQKPREVLYSAYLADVAAGNAFRQEGPNFKKAWSEFLKNPESASRTPVPKSKDKNDIDIQRKSIPATWGNNEEFALIGEILAWAGNEPNTNLNDTLEKFNDLMTKMRKERDDAIDKSLKLADQVSDLTDKVRDLEKELEGKKKK